MRGNTTRTSSTSNSSKQEYDFKKDINKEKGISLKERIRQIKNCGIGKRYQNKTFKNYNKKDNREACEKCLSYCKTLIQNLKNGTGLILLGSVGTGKTHLIAAMIDYIARMKKRIGAIRIAYYSSTELIAQIKNNFNENNNTNLIDYLKKVDILFLDDFGAEKATDWVLEFYFDIIDNRYSNLKPTVFASNLSLIEIKEKYTERIMSRIIESCDGVKLKGKDYRLEVKQ